MKTKKYYNYFYKITNNINQKFYYGVHRTTNLNDGYMGSGTLISKAIKKYGVENFSKEILKYFNTQEEAYLYESEFVNDDLVKDKMCYNVKPGGEGWCMNGRIYVYNENHDIILISKEDPKYLDGTYKSIMLESKLAAMNQNGEILSLERNDPRLLSGEYISLHKLMITVKDKNGNMFRVFKDDPRVLSGELVGNWKGLHHSEETKKIISEKNKISQKGNKNSCYGTCWIYNDKKESKQIKKEQLDEYISNGWHKGRIIQNKENIIKANQDRSWINKDGKTKQIYTKDLEQYLNDGWERGRVHNSPKYTYHEPKLRYNPWKGNVLVEIDGKKIYVPKDDPRFKTGEIQAYAKGRIGVIDKNGNKLYVKTDDPRYLSGELEAQNHSARGKVVVKDKDGNKFMVDKNDPRYLNGELTFITTGMKYKRKNKLNSKNVL